MKKHILLIDDDPDEFEFFLNALDKVPGLFECSYAVNADAAFTLLGKILPNFIFVDMNMPLVNGLECTTKLKKTDGVSEIPVFIYTTGYDDKLKKEAMRLGASGCIRKPSKPNLMVDMLKSLYATGNPDITQGRSNIS